MGDVVADILAVRGGSQLEQPHRALRKIAAVVEQLGRATAKIHGASDEDRDEDLVVFQVESAIRRSLPPAAQGSSTTWVTDFALEYAARARAYYAPP